MTYTIVDFANLVGGNITSYATGHPLLTGLLILIGTFYIFYRTNMPREIYVFVGIPMAFLLLATSMGVSVLYGIAGLLIVIVLWMLFTRRFGV